LNTDIERKREEEAGAAEPQLCEVASRRRSFSVVRRSSFSAGSVPDQTCGRMCRGAEAWSEDRGGREPSGAAKTRGEEEDGGRHYTSAPHHLGLRTRHRKSVTPMLS
jgi:hypothetical protein